MSYLIEKDEATAARRRVPCRIFLSNGTAPDTGALNDAIFMGVNSLVTISLASTLRPVHEAQGMYAVELTASEASILGTHPLYHTVGDFPQHIATVQVVQFNPMSRSSAFTSADSVGLKAVTHSQATVGGIVNWSNLSGTFSDLTVQVSSGTVSGVVNKVDLRAGVYSDVTLRLGAYDYSSVVTMGIGIAAPSLVTVQVSGGTVAGVTNKVDLRTGAYSGLTVEVNNLVGAFSAATVQVSGGTVAGVTNAVLIRDGAYSAVTVRTSGGTVDGVVNPVTASALTVTGVTNAVLVRAGTYSDVSVRLDTNAVPAGAFQVDSIDAVAMASMNLSDVTVRVHPMTYSGLTVGVNNITPAVYSGVTVGASNIPAVVDADVRFINGTAVIGDGAGTPWGP